MQWWCSANGSAWSWSWQAYPGVWILVALLGAAYLRYWRQSRRRSDTTVTARQAVAFAGGGLLLWLALDWPIGPLGASYLASVHMTQFLLVGLAAPALLLLGFPKMSYQRLREHPRVMTVLRASTHPATAFFVFNVMMTLTHWPFIVDALMPSQLGSFALDMTWLVSGMIFWWPLISPVPERPWFGDILQGAYLALNAIIISPPFALLLFSKFPVYAIYELAPPIGRTSALDDQQMAGALMKVGGAWILAIGIGVIGYRWYRRTQHGSGTPAQKRSA
jgi:cytochrome c oxidase assembly factor CtaG